MIRLSELLKKCSNKKYRAGYIKYLSALDYKEYEKIFLYYFEVISVLLIRYDKGYKKYSKKWFKYKKINKLYDRLYNLFFESNHVFLLVATENLKKSDEQKEKIFQKIEEIKKSIQSIFETEIVVNIPPTNKDYISIMLLIINTLYAKNELNKLLEELNKFKKNN